MITETVKNSFSLNQTNYLLILLYGMKNTLKLLVFQKNSQTNYSSIMSETSLSFNRLSFFYKISCDILLWL